MTTKKRPYQLRLTREEIGLLSCGLEVWLKTMRPDASEYGRAMVHKLKRRVDRLDGPSSKAAKP